MTPVWNWWIHLSLVASGEQTLDAVTPILGFIWLPFKFVSELHLFVQLADPGCCDAHAGPVGLVDSSASSFFPTCLFGSPSALGCCDACHCLFRACLVSIGNYFAVPEHNSVILLVENSGPVGTGGAGICLACQQTVLSIVQLRMIG